MVKNNIDALRSVYLSLGGSLDDTYEDINGGSPVSAYRSVKDHIAAISKLDVGGGGSGLPDVTAEDDGKTLQVVDGQWLAKNAEYISAFPAEIESSMGTLITQYAPVIIQGAGKPYRIDLSWTFGNVEDKEAFIQFGEKMVKIASNQISLAYLGGLLVIRKYMDDYVSHIGTGSDVRSAGGFDFDMRYADIAYEPRENSDESAITMTIVSALLSRPT